MFVCIFGRQIVIADFRHRGTPANVLYLKENVFVGILNRVKTYKIKIGATPTSYISNDIIYVSAWRLAVLLLLNTFFHVWLNLFKVFYKGSNRVITMISRPGSLISLELWRVDSAEVRLGVKSAQSEGEPHLVGSYQEKSLWGGIRKI